MTRLGLKLIGGYRDFLLLSGPIASAHKVFSNEVRKRFEIGKRRLPYYFVYVTKSRLYVVIKLRPNPGIRLLNASSFHANP